MPLHFDRFWRFGEALARCLGRPKRLCLRGRMVEWLYLLL
jgi:hypothetical protein